MTQGILPKRGVVPPLAISIYPMCTNNIFPVTRTIFLVRGNLFLVTRIKKNTLCHNTVFLRMKEYLLSQEINFLSQKEQRTPHVK